MKKTINEFDFRNAFMSSDSRKDTYTFEGLNALFDYFTEYEENTGEDMELDIVAICCDFSEYSNFEDLQASYPNIETMEQLENRTQVIPVGDTGRIIIQNF